MVSNDHVFQTQVLEAFDLLDVAREDAVKAFGDLLGGVTPDAAETLNVHDRAFWLDEQSFATLRKICTDGRGDTSRRLARELDLLRQRVHARPERYFPQTIGSLTLGQVRRICANAGIRVEPENRGEETEIRMALKAMGLSADADKLVPEALRCAEHGKIDDFWDIMKARKDGDPDWSDQLRELAHAP